MQRETIISKIMKIWPFLFTNSLISGGYTNNGRTNTVLKYKTSDINENPMEMEPMVHARYHHACTIFNSPAHNGRPVAIVAGGQPSSAYKTAEILDFTQEGSSWQESKLIFCSGIIFVVCTFHRQGNECNRVFLSTSWCYSIMSGLRPGVIELHQLVLSKTFNTWIALSVKGILRCKM